LNGKTAAGVWFVRLVFFLIFLTVTIAILQTVEEIKKRADLMRHLNFVEEVCVVFFTMEYLLRFYTAPEQPWLGKLGLWGRVRYVFSFFSLVDLLAIIPWYLAAANVQWADDSDELLRLFRVLRLLALDRYSSSLGLMSSVLVANKVALTATGFVAVLFWLVFSTLLYLTESQNYSDEAGMNMSRRFESVPNSLQYTAIFLTGDFPLVGFSFWGRIVNVANVLVAVGVVGIPAGIIADGYTDALQESREKVR
jgi:hypothetical protein